MHFFPLSQNINVRYGAIETPTDRIGNIFISG
jgi:hypothetical protein